MSARLVTNAAARIRRAAPTEVKVGDWLLAWHKFFPDGRSRATARHDAYMVADFRAEHGLLALGDVTALLAQEWALAHPSQVRYLRQAFEKALALRMIDVNVWRHVTLPAAEGPRRVPPTVEELVCATGAARSLGGWWLEFADLIEFTAYTGARAGGVSGLTIGDVDLRARRAELLEKGGKRRTVALLPPAQDAAGRQMLRRAGRPQTALLWRTQQRERFTRESLGRAWRAVRCDFDGPFHTLRHFAGTFLAAQGVDERDIAVQLGHFDAEGRPYTRLVRRVYVHPDHSDALARIEEAVS